MDIIFNNTVCLSAFNNGEHRRVRFDCNEEVADVIVEGIHGKTGSNGRSFHNIRLSDGTSLSPVPSDCFRYKSKATHSTDKTATASSK